MADRQQSHQPGLLLAEQDLQDLIQAFEGAVEAVQALGRSAYPDLNVVCDMFSSFRK
jgi:hypothetical protein